MSDTSDEVRRLASAVLDVVTVHEIAGGASDGAVNAVAGAIGSVSDQHGNTLVPAALLPAAVILVQRLLSELSSATQEDYDTSLAELRAWLEALEI